VTPTAMIQIGPSPQTQAAVNRALMNIRAYLEPFRSLDNNNLSRGIFHIHLMWPTNHDIPSTAAAVEKQLCFLC
jgi:hypothetical protein